MFCDNTSAVAWAFKGSTSTSIAAGRLLQLLSLCQRMLQASSLIPLHLAGKTNEMADAASQAFKDGEFFHIKNDLLTYFNSTFPIHNGSWTELKIHTSLVSWVISYLHGEALQMESLIKLPKHAFAIGKNGSNTVHNSMEPQITTSKKTQLTKQSSQSFKCLLVAITMSAKLVGKQSPFFKTEGEFILPIKWCLEGFCRKDPPSQPQLAVPSSVPKEAFKYGQKIGSDKQIAIGCLSVIAFYFLLRVGEYTDPCTVTRRNVEAVRATCTKQFRVGDIVFFKDRKPLPRDSPLEVLSSADSVTMRIDNQKNGIQGQTLHHQTPGYGGAVDALAIRVHHILSNGGNKDNLICDVYTDKKWSSIASGEMVTAGKSSITRLGPIKTMLYLHIL